MPTRKTRQAKQKRMHLRRNQLQNLCQNNRRTQQNKNKQKTEENFNGYAFLIASMFMTF